jgi:lysophospholipase L1-like esterase
MKIVGLGDSLTFGYGVQRDQGWFDKMKEHYPKFVWDNCGMPGDSSVGMLRRFLFDVEVKRPKYLTILGGANDLIGGASPKTVAGNLMQIGERAQAKKITPIFLLPFFISLNPGALGWLTKSEASEMYTEIVALREEIRAKTKENQWFCFDPMRVLPNPDAMEAYFLADGIHVNAKLHELIANELKEQNPFIL